MWLSRTQALLLEQVDSLTTFRSTLQNELASVQAERDALASQLSRFCGLSTAEHVGEYLPPERQLFTLEEKVKKLEADLQRKAELADADAYMFAEKESSLEATLAATSTRLAEVEERKKVLQDEQWE
ncbi:hypothetical protein JCM6882_001090 [Rhodosporidiobolus microsporus]